MARTSTSTSTSTANPVAGTSAAEKRQMYDEFAAVVKAFGSPVRLMILELLGQAERSVEALATAAGASVGNTSAQLQIMTDAGLVRRRRQGNRVLYRLADPEVGTLVTQLMAVADHRSASAREAAHNYLGDLDDLRSITNAELEAGLADGSIVLLDVRPHEEYTAGHIDGAHHLDAHRLTQSIQELLPDLRNWSGAGVEIVAYCRGPYCALAPQALRVLGEHGITGRLLPDGVIGWGESGRPVARDWETHRN